MIDPKLRLFAIKAYFERNTDETHTVTVPELAAYLETNGVPTDRRTLYADIALLKKSGMEILKRRTRTHDYFLAARMFELPELKLMVDAVQASRFITKRKSDQLIQKLEALTSVHQAGQLRRQVFVQNRIKAENESIYYNVDTIHTAILADRRIRFTYCQYAVDKSLRPRRDGAPYTVTPYLLMWADDNYYLIADHEEHPGLVHFRVDKMLQVEMTDTPRDRRYKTPDAAEYARTLFSMYAGDEETVEIRFANTLIGVAIDRFGRDVPIVKKTDDTFTIRTRVAVSPSFFGWLFQFGKQAEILAPDGVRLRMEALLSDARAAYAAPDPS